MTPFDINPENDAGHTLNQEDLIAFHLHELSSPQERAVHRVLRTNPALQAESLAIASTLRAFPKHEPALPLDAAALDRNWQTLRNSLPVYTPVAPRSLFPRWLFPSLAASALAATAILLALHLSPPTKPSTLAITHTPSAATATPPAASTSNTSPSTNPVIPSSVDSSSIAHAPSFAHGPAKPRSASESLSSHALPASPSATNPPAATSTPQPAASPSDTPAANTTVATTHRPQSLPTQTPLKPTFTPIIQTRGHLHAHHDHTTEITGAVFADLTPVRSFTSTAGTGSSSVNIPYSQTASPSLGVLASFHQQLRPWLGYRISASHAAPTFEYNYTVSAGGYAGIIVPENVYELSANYVVRGPHRRLVSTFAEAGAGVLAFHPTNPNAALGVSNALRATAVFGLSAELALTRHVALHVGYRGLVYKTPPAYLTENFTVPSTGNLTFSNQPVVGLTYRFHEATE